MLSVCVVMPVLNAARFLPDALASIAAQTYPPQQVIIVDGASTDETPHIARRFPNARYFQQTGAGMWNALNEGIAQARGDAIAILSSDDLWHPEKLRRQVEWLHSHLETQAVFCHALLQEIETGSALAISKPELFTRAQPAYMPEAMLARRELFQQLGAFPERYRINGDVAWFGRMVDMGIETHMLADVLLTRRFHAKNLSTAPALGAQYNRELLSVMRGKILRTRSAGEDAQ